MNAEQPLSPSRAAFAAYQRERERIDARYSKLVRTMPLSLNVVAALRWRRYARVVAGQIGNARIDLIVFPWARPQHPTRMTRSGIVRPARKRVTRNGKVVER